MRLFLLPNRVGNTKLQNSFSVTWVVTPAVGCWLQCSVYPMPLLLPISIRAPFFMVSPQAPTFAVLKKVIAFACVRLQLED